MDQELKQLEKQLNNIVAKFKEDMGGIRTNRPTTKMLEDIKVDYFGQWLTVKQLCSFNVIPPREINVNVWDKNAVGLVAKAIEGAHLGLSIAVDGNTVRINLPPLTDERRKELAKTVKAMAEKERINIRLTRDEFNKKAKAAPDEDTKHFLQEKMQKLVDKANGGIEDLVENKVKEIND